MRFMVQIEVQPLPADWEKERQDALRRREVETVVELMRQGILRSALFRIPGRNANFGVWQADSFEELDKILRGLPLHPFMHLQVTPLMAHPSEALYKAKYGEMPAMRGVNDP
jgi:muconolactone delta-isomerase